MARFCIPCLHQTILDRIRPSSFSSSSHGISGHICDGNEVLIAHKEQGLERKERDATQSQPSNDQHEQGLPQRQGGANESKPEALRRRKSRPRESKLLTQSTRATRMQQNQVIMDTLAEVEIDNRRQSQRQSDVTTDINERFELATNGSNNMEMIARFVPNRLVHFYNQKLHMTYRKHSSWGNGSSKSLASQGSGRLQSIQLKATYEKLVCS